MRKIYRIPHTRQGGRVATIAVTLALVAILVLATHSHNAVTPALAVTPAPAASDAAPTVYFPSQYELHAGPPEEPIQQF